MLSTRHALLALAPLLASATNNPPTADQLVEKAKAIKDSLKATDRYTILAGDNEYQFDFANPPTPPAKAQGGFAVAATPSNFPLLQGLGMSMTLGFLGPCGLNTPHTHPRAAEFNIAINGTLRTGLILENGARLVSHDLQPLQATIFEAGSLHFVQNSGCEPALFVAAFNADDPGTSQVAQRFFSLPQDIIAATLNGRLAEEVIELAQSIPDTVALGADECLKRCGITRPNAGKPVPSEIRKQIPAPAPSITGGFGPGQPPASGAAAKSTATSGSGSGNNRAAAGGILGNANNAAAVADDTSDGLRSNKNEMKPFMIALCVINGVLLVALGSLAAWVVWGRPKRTNGARSRGMISSPYEEDEKGTKVLFSGPHSPPSQFSRTSTPAPYDPPTDKY